MLLVFGAEWTSFVKAVRFLTASTLDLGVHATGLRMAEGPRSNAGLRYFCAECCYYSARKIISSAIRYVNIFFSNVFQ